MQRLKEEFLNLVEAIIPLSDSYVLEIGCGAGTRSVNIAGRCTKLAALEPDSQLLSKAQIQNARNNINYYSGSAEALPFEDRIFDTTIFTLSLHHVPSEKMSKAISEAVRVTKKDGYVVFLEPKHEGSFFQAEMLFDACDGDERKEKARAYFEILNFRGYQEIAEIDDETIFQFDSIQDFISALSPKQNLDQLAAFLEKNLYILNAKRRINIFKV
jgi:ubiquinone/menaquinone biosynthesis C-methylase UbiE